MEIVQKVTAAAQVVLKVHQGAFWVTRTGRGEDWLAEAGTEVVLEGRGWVVEKLEQSDLAQARGELLPLEKNQGRFQEKFPYKTGPGRVKLNTVPLPGGSRG